MYAEVEMGVAVGLAAVGYGPWGGQPRPRGRRAAGRNRGSRAVATFTGRCRPRSPNLRHERGMTKNVAQAADAVWRAITYVAVAQLHLDANPMLRYISVRPCLGLKCHRYPR